MVVVIATASEPTFNFMGLSFNQIKYVSLCLMNTEVHTKKKSIKKLTEKLSEFGYLLLFIKQAVDATDNAGILLVTAIILI